MKLLDLPEVFGYTLFCDDIRVEADGKINYIGTYLADLNVNAALPILVPKFAFGITLFQKEELFQPNVKLLIFMPGDTEDVASIQADITEATPGETAKSRSRSKEPYIAARAHLILAPFTINQTGTIRVRAIHRDKMIRLGALGVIQPSEYNA